MSLFIGYSTIYQRRRMSSIFSAGSAGTALNFLKGQVMRLSKGKANPALAGEISERNVKGKTKPIRAAD
ncbi:MAG: hypothetical protein WBN75_00140 [Verrucomicrobiia bacterium]